MRLFTLRFLFFSLAILALSIDLNAQISASATEGCAPLASVQFSNAYSNPTGILWDFDDGATSNLPNPVHSFANAGVYEVSFTATVGGNTVNETLIITVYGNPIADFTVNPEGVCLGQSQSFQDASTGGSGSAITNWQWDYGDGTPSGSGPNTSHTYPATGLYNVTLIVTDANGCVSASSQPNAAAVSVPPNLNISTNPSPAFSCEPPLTVSFTNSSTSNSPLGGGLTYDWNFGNGETSNAATPSPVTYDELGNFVITVTATDNAGCSATQNFSVSVQEPVADFEVVGAEDGVVCSQIEIVNTGTPGGVFNYGDGTSGTSLIHNYSAAGTYTITLNLNVAGCPASTSETITVEIPTAEIVSDPGFACFKPADFSYSLESDFNITEFEWFFSNGSNSASPNPTQAVDYNGPNEYAINGLVLQTTVVQFTTSNGCSGFASILDSIALPNALFYPDVSQGCAPLTVEFEDNSSYYFDDELVTWQWHFGDGTITNQNTSTDETHIYNDAGEYEAFLIVTNSAGCIDTSFTHVIEVGEPVNASFSFEPNPICQGEVVTITNTSADDDLIDSYSYEGDNNTLHNCISEDSPEFVFDDIAGTFPITQFAEYNGCITEVSQNITVNGPVGKLSYGCNCETPLDYTFEAEIYEADSWTWDFGDGTVIENSTALFISHSYANSGDYTATLTSFSNSSGCEPYVDQILVKVRELDADLNIPELACAGTVVDLSAASSQFVGDDQDGCRRNYLWYFGDNTRPIKTLGPQTTHTYNGNGDFEVTLFVKDDNDCVDSVRSTIRVFDIEAAYAADTLTGCPPIEVNFTDLSLSDTTIVNWNWNFDDGASSGDEDPQHIFSDISYDSNNAPIPFTISLTVTDILGCTSTIDDLVIQPLGPNPDFEAITDATICEGESVTFAPTGSNPNFHTYAWNYGNGSTADGSLGLSQYTEAGAYTITLVVTDTTGCSRELSLPLVDVQAFPTAIIQPSFDEGEVLCYPVIVGFTDASVINPFGNRTWELNLGGPTLTGPSVQGSYLQPGFYDIELEVATTYGCAHDTTLQIEVQGPVADIALNPDAICPGGSIELNLLDTADLATWQFDFGDGNEETNQWPTFHTYDPTFIPTTGSTVLTLVMFSEDSVCSAARTIDLIIEEVIAGFDRNNEAAVLDSIHCFGVPDVFTNTSTPNANQFTWTVSTGSVFNSFEPPSNFTLPPGSHTIELAVESALGCQDTIVKTMEIFPLPEPTVNGGAICRGESIVLTATGGASYLWTPTTGLDDPTSSTVVANPLTNQNYNVLVTDTNDCSASAVSNVRVFQPAPSISVDTILRIGDTDFAGFYLGEGYTYTWTPNIELECDTCAETTFRPLEDRVYTLTISDTLGCFSTESFFSFEILEVASVVLPDAFTPNGDGVNDVIYVKGWGIESLESFAIYNRWGELVFQTSDINQGWDGFYKGELQNSDSYAYIVVAKNFIKDAPETFKGFIDLIR